MSWSQSYRFVSILKQGLSLVQCPMVTIRAREEYEIVAKGQTGRWRRSFIDATTTHRQAGKISLFWSVVGTEKVLGQGQDDGSKYVSSYNVTGSHRLNRPGDRTRIFRAK